jgi:hypothetical protein
MIEVLVNIYLYNMTTRMLVVGCDVNTLGGTNRKYELKCGNKLYYRYMVLLFGGGRESWFSVYFIAVVETNRCTLRNCVRFLWDDI